MSYTPDDQVVGEHVNTIVGGIDRLISAFHNRHDDRTWKSEHLEYIAELESELVMIRAKLRHLQRNTC